MIPWPALLLTVGCCRADKPDILRKSTDEDKGMRIQTERVKSHTYRLNKAQWRKRMKSWKKSHVDRQRGSDWLSSSSSLPLSFGSFFFFLKIGHCLTRIMVPQPCHNHTILKSIVLRSASHYPIASHTHKTSFVGCTQRKREKSVCVATKLDPKEKQQHQHNVIMLDALCITVSCVTAGSRVLASIYLILIK